MAVALLGTGCDLVFALEPRALDTDAGPGAYDPCAPSFDDPGVRYAVIANPTIVPEGGVPAPWAWSAARSECLVRGMDLAVLNDQREFGGVDVET